MAKTETIQIPEEYNVSIANGKRGRNPNAPTKALWEAFEVAGIPLEEQDVQDALATVAELQDKYASEVLAQAQEARTEAEFMKTAKKLDKAKLQALLAKLQ